MIHHLARAFHVRERAAMLAAANADHVRPPASPATNRPAPVRPRPITPWGVRPQSQAQGTQTPVRITSDPADARRTVIAGRLAEVCAALDRLVNEQEALA